MKTIILILFLTVNSFATNWYLSTSSSGAANGNSWANKIIYTSFDWANVNAGDIVYLDGSTTASSLTYTDLAGVDRDGSSGSRITITKDTADANHNGTVIIDAGGRTQGFVIDGDYVTVKHLKFTDATEGTSGFEIIRINGNYVYVMNNTIIYTVSKGIRADTNVGSKILYNYMDTGAISDGAESDGIWLGNNGGNIEIAYNSIYMRNTVAGPHKDCIQTYGWQQSAGTSGLTSTIHHNFFYSGGVNMIDNTVLEGGGIGGYWYFTNNIVVYARFNSGRALSSGLCSESPYQTYPLYLHIENNTIYCVGDSGAFAMQINYTDTLIVKNNIIRVSPNSIYQPIAIDENCRTSGYMLFDYNQYVVTNINDFDYENYNTNIDDCDDTDARSVSWTTWRTTYGQDAHSELSNSDVFDFVGAGFPYTGRQLPTTDSSKYALDAGSTGIDEGTTISYITNDYAGTTRPQNSIYDLGAFEYGVAPTQTRKVRVIIIQ